MLRIVNKLHSRQKERLPLLKFISEQYSNTEMSDCLVIACQHLLGTTFDLFIELIKKGLKSKNIYLIGKCYSTNQKTFQRFVDLGVNVSRLSTQFNSYSSFDEQFKGYIESFLQNLQLNINPKEFKKVIILDDGGNLILFASDFFDNTTNFVGIEQTSSGYEKIRNVNLSFPVINVARSRAKLQYESPMIGDLICEKVRSYIELNRIKNPQILVIGQGYIGQAISQNLKHDFTVNSCDKLAHKCDFNGDYRFKFGDYDIIIGASGNTILSAGDFGKLKKGVTLISASSSDAEFSSVYLRRLEPQTHDCHKDFNTSKVKLLNGGFPINFDGNEHSLTPEKIQFTRALLLASIFEAMEINHKSGLKELKEEVQNKIIDKCHEIKVF